MTDETKRELDVRVAEKIFGYETRIADEDGLFSICMLGNCDNRDYVEPGEPYIYFQEEGHQPEKRFPHYSTDIAAAYQVEEHIAVLGLQEAYMTALWDLAGQETNYDDAKGRFAYKHASPLNICKAALKAMGGE